MSEKETSLKDLFSKLGQLVAIIMILRYGVLIVNHYVNFLGDSEAVCAIMNYVGLYAPLALMTLVGLSAVWEKSDIIKLLFLLICAAVIIITFFPGVAESITGWLGVGSSEGAISS